VVARLLGLLLAGAPLALQAAISLPQADGGTLVLQQPTERIVTLAPHLAEGVFAAGAGAQLVGAVEFSEHPPAAARIPRVGDAFRLDIERIMALRPDLVIAWDSGTPRPAVEQLKNLKLPVWSVEIREPLGIPGFIELAGLASGHTTEAAEEAARLRQGISALEQRYRDASPVSFFYQVEAKPLFTISGSHLISRGLNLCGGHNVFATEPGLAFQVARESVILANPDAMLAPRTPGTPDPLLFWRDWPDLNAVKHRALFLLPADEISRATPRFLDALDASCKLLDDLRGRIANG